MERNVIEQGRDHLVAVMDEMDRAVRDYAAGMEPYEQDRLTPEEESFFFDNMAVFYQQEFPGIDNAAAMRQYREDVGDDELVAFYERVYKYRMGLNVAGQGTA